MAAVADDPRVADMYVAGVADLPWLDELAPAMPPVGQVRSSPALGPPQLARKDTLSSHN